MRLFSKCPQLEASVSLCTQSPSEPSKRKAKVNFESYTIEKKDKDEQPRTVPKIPFQPIGYDLSSDAVDNGAASVVVVCQQLLPWRIFWVALILFVSLSVGPLVSSSDQVLNGSFKGTEDSFSSTAPCAIGSCCFSCFLQCLMAPTIYF